MSKLKPEAVEESSCAISRPLTAKPASSRKGGRPVTWIGGGGLSPSFVASKGVPELRALFLEVFGHPTASNNSTWLRRKLSEPPDATFGRGRSAKIRRRDLGAAIWTTGNVASFTHAEATILQKAGESPPGNNIISFPSSARNSMTGSETCSGPGSAACTPRKRPRQTPSTPLELLMHQLKQVASPVYWVDSPPTVEVFWPEEGNGGSWWPARVLKVMPKKALCSVLYDTSESEDLNLKEMLEMKHIRVVESCTLEGASDSSWSERDAKFLKPMAAGSIADAVCNSVKEELGRIQQEDATPAVPLEDAEHEAMLQTLIDEAAVSECDFQHLEHAGTEEKMPDSLQRPQVDTAHLQQPPLLAPVKIRFEDQAHTSLDTKGSDASAGSCEMWSPESTTQLPSMDMYHPAVLDAYMAKRGLDPLMPLSGMASEATGFVDHRVQDPKDRTEVAPNIFQEDFLAMGLNTLIDEEASSSQAFHNMDMTSLLPCASYY
mmetsp:Transcript_1487/g.3539  ORF Transcript_1487/g.3539 Transcript_1487/m.3539 type:complete len:491 (+) Transcript_1487:229-1701(+)